MSQPTFDRRPGRNGGRARAREQTLACLIALVAAGATAAWAAEGSPDATTAAAAPTHRPLRQNVETTLGEPTEPERFEGYPSAIPFQVVPQKDQLALFPCSQCHKALPINTSPRKLVAAPHNNALHHGKGRFWCLDCHLASDRDFLHTISGQKVDFNDAYLVCGQCHFNRQKDWYLGGHGKRAVNWQGPRTIYNCTHCHDPHNPVIQPRRPSKPPPVRAGLAPMSITPEATPRIWERARNGGQP